MKQPNRVKAAMRAGRKSYGFNLFFPSPWVIDILGNLDFDLVFIDGEHGRQERRINGSRLSPRNLSVGWRPTGQRAATVSYPGVADGGELTS
jgi:hypothetical protein